MKEFYDASRRLAVELPGDDYRQFRAYADRLVAMGGELVEQIDGFEQLYWDFLFGETIVVLHADVFVGVSVHVEGVQNDVLLRRVAAALVDTA